MKTFTERYDALPQKKQTFYVDDVQVRFEVKPYPVKTKSGLRGGIMTECMVANKSDLACVGKAVCIPTDKFDFVFGCRLALQNALKVEYVVSQEIWDGMRFVRGRMVKSATRKAIWAEFNRVLPKIVLEEVAPLETLLEQVTPDNLHDEVKVVQLETDEIENIA